MSSIRAWAAALAKGAWARGVKYEPPPIAELVAEPSRPVRFVRTSPVVAAPVEVSRVLPCRNCGVVHDDGAKVVDSR